jgi:hypothetical protein
VKTRRNPTGRVSFLLALQMSMNAVFMRMKRKKLAGGGTGTEGGDSGKNNSVVKEVSLGTRG